MTKETKGLSRRSFVAASGVAVAGAAMTPSVSFASFGPHLEADTLADFIGTTFKASSDLGDVAFKLVKVEKTGKPQATPAGVRSQAFRAEFKAAHGVTPYQEGIYKMRHATLGATDIFLQACDEDACTGRMSAAFA
ncbi:MAG: twin-arginine translocation signal domain-containing protein [Pseudomonadota bacterium]